jgi:endonuclease YncB( thermonuclease family)
MAPSTHGLLGNTIHQRRALARIWIAGRDVGENLIAEGHALPWQDGWEAWEKRHGIAAGSVGF